MVGILRARYVAFMSREERRAIPLVSVIVPVRNGRSDLLTVIESLEAQTMLHEQFELVIGDDGSTDGSTHDLPPCSFSLTVTTGPPRNSYAARNRAVHASSGTVARVL